MVTTITSGFVYFTSGALSGGPPYTTITGGTTVPVMVIDIEDTGLKSIKAVPRPVSLSQASGRDPKSRIIDLRRITRTLKIIGKIYNDTDGTILAKKTDLMNLSGFGAGAEARSGVVTFVAHEEIFNNTDTNDNSISVNFTKILIKQGAKSFRKSSGTTRGSASVTIQITEGYDSW